jgi:hypothetical protein
VPDELDNDPPGYDAYGNVNIYGGSNVQIGGQQFVVDAKAFPDVGEARELFTKSLRHRDEFVADFLKQALQQASATFKLSIFFMSVGGLIVLCAASLALTRFAGSPSHGIALISGIGGVLISTSGAAFSLRADKARKHLAQQATVMQSQLVEERRFVQVIDLLTGIKDPHLNDQARVSMAMRLMGEIEASRAAIAGLTKAQAPADRQLDDKSDPQATAD